MKDAADWYDTHVLKTLSCLVEHKLDELATIIAQLPGNMGGFGLRSQTEISEYAHECVFADKGEQHRQTQEADKLRQSSLFLSLSGLEKAIVTAGSAPGAARPLTDPTLDLSDRAWLIYARQRLLIPVLPHGSKCVCGSLATNDHVNVCPRIVKLWRHDEVVQEIDVGLRAVGKTTHVEPLAAPGSSKARPDLRCEDNVIDAMITYPGKAALAHRAPSVLAAAQLAGNHKKTKWGKWATARALNFAPFVVESTGGFLEDSRRWLRTALGDSDTPITISSTFNFITGRVLRATLHGAVGLFAAAAGG